MRSRQLALVMILAALPSTTSSVRAQTPDDRFRISGLAGATGGDGGSATAVGVTLRYRPAWRLALEVEASRVERLDFGEFPVCPPGTMCLRGGSFTLHRRAVPVTASVGVELPAPARWIRPYVLAGGGLAYMDREIRDPLDPRETSTRGRLLTLGGGVDLMLWTHGGLGFDARHQRVSAEDPRPRSDMADAFAWTRLAATFNVRF